jgi:hypothetical protein
VAGSVRHHPIGSPAYRTRKAIGENRPSKDKDQPNMRYYMPRNDLAAVVRDRARQRKLEAMWQLLTLLGMILAATALLNGFTGFAG